MTQQEFDSIKWHADMGVQYRGALHAVVSVNFYEKLLGIVFGENTGDEDEDDLIWVRCESVEIVK